MTPEEIIEATRTAKLLSKQEKADIIKKLKEIYGLA